MKVHGIAVLAGASLLATGQVHAQTMRQSSGQGTLLVLSKRDHTLALVDPATLKVEGRVPVGEDPHEVIASADGSTAYVSNYGFGAYHTLAVVDLRHKLARTPVDLGPLTGPHGLTFAGGETWFTAEGAKAFGRYNPHTGKIDLVLGTGQNRTHMIWVSPDQQHIVTTNVSSGTVSLIDRVALPAPGPPPGGPGKAAPGPPPQAPRTDWNETVVEVGRGAEGFDLSPDGRWIWVANAQDGTVSVIDRAAKRVTATLPLQVSGANRLKFTPDGRYVLISLLGGPPGASRDREGSTTHGNVVVVDAATRQVVRRIDAGRGAAGILMEPGGARAFVSCSPDNYVAVINLQTLAVVAHIDAGADPDGLAWAVR